MVHYYAELECYPWNFSTVANSQRWLLTRLLYYCYYSLVLGYSEWLAGAEVSASVQSPLIRLSVRLAARAHSTSSSSTALSFLHQVESDCVSK